MLFFSAVVWPANRSRLWLLGIFKNNLLLEHISMFTSDWNDCAAQCMNGVIGCSYWSDSPCICPMVRSRSSQSMPEHRTCFTLNWQNWGVLVHKCFLLAIHISIICFWGLYVALFRLLPIWRITIMSVSCVSEECFDWSVSLACQQ